MAVNSSQGKTEDFAGLDRSGAVWVRDDGSICFGNECIIMSHKPDSDELDIKINPGRCGPGIDDKVRETIFSTIGRGGQANFKIKGRVDEE